MYWFELTCSYNNESKSSHNLCYCIFSFIVLVPVRHFMINLNSILASLLPKQECRPNCNWNYANGWTNRPTDRRTMLVAFNCNLRLRKFCKISIHDNVLMRARYFQLDINSVQVRCMLNESNSWKPGIIFIRLWIEL